MLLTKVFEKTELYGCSFHFGQYLNKRIQALGLSSFYLNDPEYRKVIRSFLVWHLFPSSNLKEAFTKFLEIVEIKQNKELNSFLEYFLQNFLGWNYIENKIEFENSVYKPIFWNLYERTKFSHSRTINSVEAWHRTLNKHSKVAHPNIGKIVETFQKIEEITRVNVLNALTGRFDFSNYNLEREKKLFVLISSFNFFDIVNYLQVLDECFTWKVKLK